MATKWEGVDDGDRMNHCRLQRLRVPGGWLFRQLKDNFGPYGIITSVALAFVPHAPEPEDGEDA